MSNLHKVFCIQCQSCGNGSFHESFLDLILISFPEIFTLARRRKKHIRSVVHGAEPMEDIKMLLLVLGMAISTLLLAEGLERLKSL
jgi:hypothetical protein